ncbi:hypothetical protein Tco_1148202, partial [Tanacetum coccineum]
ACNVLRIILIRCSTSIAFLPLLVLITPVVLAGTLNALLTKYMGICLVSLSVIRTALTVSFAAASPMEITLLRAFFKVLKNGNDFSADLAKNMFRLASFPFNFCTSFKHFRDGRLKTTSTLSGHTFNPLSFERLFYVSDYLILRVALDKKVIYIYFKVSANLFMECFIHQTLPLYASKKHLKGNPHRDSTFQSISGSG